jgi:hypothetical protein
VTLPVCVACGKRTNEHGWETDREKMCASCFRLSKLIPFDEADARRRMRDMMIGQYYKPNGAIVGSKNLDQCATDLRRIMRPPKGREWNVILTAEIWCRGLNWPI